MITVATLSELAGTKPTPIMEGIALPLDVTLASELPLRVAHFVAQICYESQMFTRLEENLRYTHADRIAAVWPKLKACADTLTNNPQSLADIAYAGILGNGSAATGDGWRYRGRGLIQVTGRDNYQAASDATGLPLLAQPDLAADAGTAVEVARWFWHMRACDAAADADDVRAVTAKINGPALEGLAERKFLTERAKRIFMPA